MRRVLNNDDDNDNDNKKLENIKTATITTTTQSPPQRPNQPISHHHLHEFPNQRVHPPEIATPTQSIITYYCLVSLFPVLKINIHWSERIYTHSMFAKDTELGFFSGPSRDGGVRRSIHGLRRSYEALFGMKIWQRSGGRRFRIR